MIANVGALFARRVRVRGRVLKLARGAARGPEITVGPAAARLMDARRDILVMPESEQEEAD